MLSKGTKREVVNMKTLLEKEEQIKIKDLRPWRYRKGKLLMI